MNTQLISPNRTVTVLLLCVFSLALVACGNKSVAPEAPAEEAAAAPVVEEAPPEVAEPLPVLEDVLPVVEEPPPPPPPQVVAEPRKKPVVKKRVVQKTPPVDPNVLVDQMVAMMRNAELRFDAPTTLQLTDTGSVELNVSLARSVDNMRRELASSAGAKKVLDSMSIALETTLQADGFQVTPLADQSQPLEQSSRYDWRWEIKPSTAGGYNVRAQLNAVFTMGNHSVSRDIRSFDRTVSVEAPAPPPPPEPGFLEKYGLWLLALLLVIIVGAAVTMSRKK
ncbi:MAG: hypothetical protein OEW58_02075 [Gammaproteobacteria bacterium]|nr:hypothetical protein [Gammaproteobacteria bacterium]